MNPIVQYQPIDKLIVQSNELVNGKFNFSRDELRIFLYLLLKIKKGDKEFEEVKVPCHLLHQGKVGVHYDEIHKAADKLTSQKIGVESKDRKGKRKFEFIPLMAICSYKEGAGYITAQFNSKMEAHLLDLSEYFTAAQYKLFMEITSFYSYRIYWLLKQYEDFKVRTFEIDELKAKLDVEKKYMRYADFKRRILNPAKLDLKKSDMSFTFQEIKSGRKVEKIKFSIVGKQWGKLPEERPKKLISAQPEIDFNTPSQDVIDKNIKILVCMGFKRPEAEQIFNIIEDKQTLKKVLYKYETDCSSLQELNNEKTRQEFLDLFQLEATSKA